MAATESFGRWITFYHFHDRSYRILFTRTISLSPFPSIPSLQLSITHISNRRVEYFLSPHFLVLSNLCNISVIIAIHHLKNSIFIWNYIVVILYVRSTSLMRSYSISSNRMINMKKNRKNTISSIQNTRYILNVICIWMFYLIWNCSSFWLVPLMLYLIFLPPHFPYLSLFSAYRYCTGMCMGIWLLVFNDRPP